MVEKVAHLICGDLFIVKLEESTKVSQGPCVKVLVIHYRKKFLLDYKELEKEET